MKQEQQRFSLKRALALSKRGDEPAALLTLTLGAAGVGAVYIATHSGGVSSIEPLVMILGVVLILASLRDYRTGIKALLVVLIIEGALRKWFVPSASELVYFYKDFVMVAILVGYYRKRQKSGFVIHRQLKLIN